MTYTIDTAYSSGIPTVESQRELIKGEFNTTVTGIIFKLTSSTIFQQKYTFSVETSLTPVIENKMSGKELAEKLIERLIKQLVNRCNKSKTLNVELPSEKSPCLYVYENEKGETMLKAELSFCIE